MNVALAMLEMTVSDSPSPEALAGAREALPESLCGTYTQIVNRVALALDRFAAERQRAQAESLPRLAEMLKEPQPMPEWVRTQLPMPHHEADPIARRYGDFLARVIRACFTDTGAFFNGNRMHELAAWALSRSHD